MRIPRIYCSNQLSVDDLVKLDTDASNHLVNVLRLTAQHPIILFNGDGNEYSAVLTEVSKRSATARIDTQISLNKESNIAIHLAQSVSRGEKMEWLIQKSVELGVQAITPIISERCGVKLSADRWQKKQQQWQKVILSACEQCGRNIIPTLHPVMSLNDWLAQPTEQLRITFDPQAETAIRHLNLPSAGVRLLIGPEGGLTDNEIYTSEQNGYQRATLGPRILRTETAALASISALQAIFGDI